MEGADGADAADGTNPGGSGGLIENYTLDVSSFSTLKIWVGENPGGETGGAGRANGGDGDGGGGGSTEIWDGDESTFLAAADAGGGAIKNAYPQGGGGGARGGLGGEGGYGPGTDAEGSGFGGDGGDADYDAKPGGQEINSTYVITSGSTTKGGSTGGNGEIQVTYDPLASPSNIQITDSSVENQLTIDWDPVSEAAGYYVYRAQSSGSSKSDYTQVADVSSPPYTDTGLEDGEKYYYRVASYANI